METNIEDLTRESRSAGLGCRLAQTCGRFFPNT